MDGIISNFRMSKRRQRHTQMIVKLPLDSNKGVNEFIGKTVIWKSPTGKEIRGNITKEHGRNGCVRVLFEKGMPGQAVGSKVNIT